MAQKNKKAERNAPARKWSGSRGPEGLHGAQEAKGQPARRVIAPQAPIPGAESSESPHTASAAPYGGALKETPEPPSAGAGVVRRPTAVLLGLLLLLSVALPSFLLSVFLLLGRNAPQAAAWIAAAGLIGIVFHQRKTLGLRGCLAFFALLAGCCLYAYLSIDLSTDGLAYHQPAIRRIVNGFNPVYDGYLQLGRQPDIWSDQATYFPKALWYYSASLTAALGDIQFGKAYGPILLCAALLFILGSLHSESRARRALWVVACLNPIALTQLPHGIADGALASLTTIALCYAFLFFTEKPITGLQHTTGIIALAMLFGVKTSGFGYACLIMFFIALHAFAAPYQKTARAAGGGIQRLAAAGKAAVQRGLRLGIPVFALVLIWGFAPYATNLIKGKHIFYPLVADGSPRSGHVQEDAEQGARIVYPDAHNRVTRLLVSIAAHTTLDKTEPAKLKSPLDVSPQDWKDFGQSYHVRAAGLGPLFFLYLLLALPAPLLFGLRGNGWLLGLLAALLFVQPYSWLMRFAPFLWVLPSACLLSLPEKRSFLIWPPLFVALINVAGVTYCAVSQAWVNSRGIGEVCSLFAGELVMIPQTIYEYDGVFERYGIRQKFVNPEETDPAAHAQGVGWGRLSGPRLENGVNMFLKRDLQLVPLPERTVVFSQRAGYPYRVMSEGLRRVSSIQRHGGYAYEKERWLSRGNTVKLYMAVNEDPSGDYELLLKGAMIAGRGSPELLDVRVFINNQEIGVWQLKKSEGKESSITLAIPQALLAESFADESRLVTLMLRLEGVPRRADPAQTALWLEAMRIRPRENG